MEQAQPNDSVESVLNAHKSKGYAGTMLSYTKDIRGFTQDTTLELMVSNDHFTSMMATLKSLESSVKDGFSELSRSIMSTHRAMTGSEDIEADYVDVTPGGSNLPVPVSNTEKNEQASYADSVVRFLSNIADATGEMAFYTRVIVRDLEQSQKLGAGGPAKPSQEKPKPDKPKGMSEGIFDWILDSLGITQEFAIISGFLSKFKKRLTGTFANMGTMFNKTIGFFTKGLGKAFTYLETSSLKFLNPIGKLGNKLMGKAAGVNFAKIIPGIGWAITAVMAISDAANALKDSHKITGKAKEFQTLGDKVNVGISGIISGFTFGLVSTKSVYKWIKFAEDSIGGALMTVFKMFPAPLQKVVTGISDFLFDPKTGIFGSLRIMFEGILDKLSNGQYGSALLDVILFIPKAAIDIVKKSFVKIKDIFSGDSTLKQDIWDMMRSMFAAIKDWAVNTVTSFAKNPMGAVSSLWEKVTDVNSSAREARLQDIETRTDEINKLLAMGKKKEAAKMFADLQSFAKNNSLASDEQFMAQSQSRIMVAKAALEGPGTQVARVSAQPTGVETNQTMSDSKSRLDTRPQMPEIVVTPQINMPPPPPEKPRITRRTEGSLDKGLAFANYVGG